MNHLDLFSGIGGFSLGLKKAGLPIKQSFNSDIDKHANAIYKQNFPESTALGSVVDVRRRDLPRIDIITFGSPCQDFSLAGNREGISGDRSGLIREAIRLIAECRPNFFIWENVKGVYSTNDGADFWAIIQAFANIGGYRLGWQLLNTAWVLPQNRERVYLVGYLGDRGGEPIFPIGEANKFCHEPRALEEKIHTDNRNAITQCARQYASWCGDFVRVVQKPRYGNPAKYSEICPTIEASRFEQKTHLAIGAVRGRNPGNPKSSVSGLPTEQMLEINERGISNTLTSVQKDNYVVEWPSIRRLTEIECERLQGFPDNWTQRGNYDGEVKQVAATNRYKCLGNAVTVDVVQMVGKSIKKTGVAA